MRLTDKVIVYEDAAGNEAVLVPNHGQRRVRGLAVALPGLPPLASVERLLTDLGNNFAGATVTLDFADDETQFLDRVVAAALPPGASKRRDITRAEREIEEAARAEKPS